MIAPATRRGTAPAVAARDSGAGLVESIVAVVLIGIVSVGILAAVATAIRGSKVHSDKADDQERLAAAADWLMTGNVAYESCGDSAYVESVAYSGGAHDRVNSAGAAAGIVSVYSSALAAKFGADYVEAGAVLFWDDATGDWGATCHALDQGDLLQQVTLVIPERPVSELTIVKLPPNAVAVEGGIVWPPPLAEGSPTAANFQPHPCAEGC